MRKVIKYTKYAYIFTLFTVVSCTDSGIVKDIPAPPDNQILSESSSKAASQTKYGPIKGQYIVIFNDKWQDIRSTTIAGQVRSFTNTFLNQANIPIDSVVARFEYVLHGFTAHIDAVKAEKLRKNPLIDRIVQDQYFKAVGFNYKETSSGSYPTTATLASASQITSWGITRINGPLDGTGKKAWILDSGIDES